MVVEAVDIDIKIGEEDAFVATFVAVRPLLADTPGCRSVRLIRGVESPSRFLLIVEWDSIDAHRVNFQETERAGTWRAALGRFFADRPRAGHFVDSPAVAP